MNQHVKLKEMPEVLPNPVQIGSVWFFIFKNPNEGQRYTPVSYYKNLVGRRDNANKKVCQFSLERVFLNEFSSIRDASEKTGVSKNSIWESCTNRALKPKRFFFSYKNNINVKTEEKKEWDYSNKNFQK